MIPRATSAARKVPITSASDMGLRPRLPNAVPSHLQPCVNPVAHFRLDPADRTRTELDGFRKRTLLDVLIDGAAGEPGTRFDLPAAKDGWLAPD